MTAGELARRLHARPAGDGYMARCPAHEDRQASLSLGTGSGGRVLLRCHAGCTYDDIVGALGLEAADLAGGRIDTSRGARGPAATYVYRARDGRTVLTVTRWRTPAGKTFRREPRGVRGDQVPVYRLPDLVDAARVWVVEGERDVDTLAALGLAATCCAGGAGKWLPHHTDQVLEAIAPDAPIYVLPDLDAPGRTHAAQVAAAFTARGRPIHVIELPFAAPVPPGGDVSDWVARGGTVEQLRALADASPVWTPGAPTSAPPDLVVLRCASDIAPTPVSWLWPGRIATGKTTLIAGHPGTGKSQLTCALASAVTTGGRWPDGTSAPRGSVVMLSAEDDAADTVVPRLLAAGADLTRVHVVQAIRDVSDDGQVRERGIRLDRDVAALGHVIVQLGDVALVTVDPVTAYMGATDTHRTSDVRAVLAPVEALAQRHGVAVVAVSHLTKGGGPEALTRVTGSLAFVAAARAAYLVVRDPEDETRRLLLSAKANLAVEPPGLAYTVAGVSVTAGTTEIPTSRVAWLAGTVDLRADEALAQSATAGEDRTARDEAVEWLRSALKDGPLPRRKLEQQARDDGMALATVKRGAKFLGVEMTRSGFGAGSIWSLPSPSGSPTDHSAQHQTLSRMEPDEPNGQDGDSISAPPRLKVVTRQGGESPTLDDPDSEAADGTYY